MKNLLVYQYNGRIRYNQLNELIKFDFVGRFLRYLEESEVLISDTLYVFSFDSNNILTNVVPLSIDNMAYFGINMCTLWDWYYKNYYFVELSDNFDAYRIIQSPIRHMPIHQYDSRCRYQHIFNMWNELAMEVDGEREREKENVN